MLGKAVILYSADKAESRRVAACLRAAGNEVLRLSSPATVIDLIRAAAVDLVFIDYDTVPNAIQVLDAAAGQVPVVALSRAPDASALLDLVCERGVDNFLARRGGKDSDRHPFDSTEIVVTAEKILRRDLFGLRKYVSAFGIELGAIEVRAAEDRDTVVACVQEHVRNLGAGRELAATLGAVADELTTNAVYNAPVDAHGRPRYASRSRRDKIVLRPEEYVSVEFGSDGRTFGLAVTDRFGQLTREQLRSGLKRCLTARDPIEKKAGGAGLGLYTVLSSVNQLIVNVEPGARTEVIALVGVDGRMREVRSSGHSLHLFISRPDDTSGVVEAPSVQLSDSMRVDLRTVVATDGSGIRVNPAMRPGGHEAGGTAGAPPEAQRLSRGTFFLGGGHALAIDTVVGAVRGAQRLEHVIEVALLFLIDRYAGAVLWAVEDGVLMAWCGAGQVADWDKLLDCILAPQARCQPVSAARQPVLYLGRASAAPMDRVVSRLTAGAEAEAVLYMPLASPSGVRYVLHAFRQQGRQRLESAEAAVLHRELTAALRRLGPLTP
ncbi:MAG: hypothetical protein HY906_22605 [Deltaproteobacteria bacterium]|nr:hypothetical protein [Deltaproteobacteria bacterium]